MSPGQYDRCNSLIPHTSKLILMLLGGKFAILIIDGKCWCASRLAASYALSIVRASNACLIQSLDHRTSLSTVTECRDPRSLSAVCCSLLWNAALLLGCASSVSNEPFSAFPWSLPPSRPHAQHFDTPATKQRIVGDQAEVRLMQKNRTSLWVVGLIGEYSIYNCHNSSKLRSNHTSTVEQQLW